MESACFFLASSALAADRVRMTAAQHGAWAKAELFKEAESCTFMRRLCLRLIATELRNFLVKHADRNGVIDGDIDEDAFYLEYGQGLRVGRRGKGQGLRAWRRGKGRRGKGCWRVRP